MTDPQSTKEFVTETGVDFLASLLELYMACMMVSLLLIFYF